MALSVTVLKNHNFRLLMLTRIAGMFALQAQAVIVGWQVYTLTHDPFMLGLVGLFEAVPAIIGSLFAGHVVDISRPHRVYLVCISILALNSLALLLLAGGFFSLDGDITLQVLFAGVFISGIARSFIMPASFTMLSQLVPRSDIPAASAWLSSGFQFAAICGPAVAGIIYGGYGVMVVWFIPVVFMSVAVMSLASMQRHHRHYRSAEKREPAWQSIKAGWRFILHDRTLLSIMLLDMFAVLFGGAVAMLPAFADTVLRTGSEGLGLLRASPAVGSIITALYLALYPMKQIRARLLLWVVAGFGACMIGFGLSETFGMAAFFLALSGAFDSVSMVVRSTLFQLLIPDAMRGRVSAVGSMFIISSNEIGAFESGVAARLMGLVPSIIFGGCASLSVVVATALCSPKLRRLVVDTEAKR
jgi:MFS family permease